MGLIPGLVKGLAVTGGTVVRTVFPKRGLRTMVPAPSKGAATVQYPHEKETPTARARGVIALHEGNCTACMLCARECPDWCIYIEGHKEKAPRPRRPGGKPRLVNKLDRFDIDYALCMFCGICVEVCPFEALFWSPEYEFSEPRIADLLHDKERLSEWMETVPDFEDYEVGIRGQEAESTARVIHATGLVLAAAKADGDLFVAQNVFFGMIAVVMIVAAVRCVTTRNIVRAALWLVLVLAGAAAQFILLGSEFVAITQVLVYIGAIIVLFLFGVMLTRASMGEDETVAGENRFMAGLVAVLLAAVVGTALIHSYTDTRLDIAEPQLFAEVSDAIFSQYIVAFEAVSVLLLAALIGAIVVARKE